MHDRSAARHCQIRLDSVRQHSTVSHARLLAALSRFPILSSLLSPPFSLASPPSPLPFLFQYSSCPLPHRPQSKLQPRVAVLHETAHPLAMYHHLGLAASVTYAPHTHWPLLDHGGPSQRKLVAVDRRAFICPRHQRSPWQSSHSRNNDLGKRNLTAAAASGPPWRDEWNVGLLAGQVGLTFENRPPALFQPTLSSLSHIILPSLALPVCPPSCVIPSSLVHYILPPLSPPPPCQPIPAGRSCLVLLSTTWRTWMQVLTAYSMHVATGPGPGPKG